MDRKDQDSAGAPDAPGLVPDLSSLPGQKRKYIQVGYELRKELIEVINQEHLTIKSAAERLNINYPTAKNIVKLYRREQRIEKLPKRAGLTIKKITSAPEKTEEDALYQAALSPFYNLQEAERIMGRRREPGPAAADDFDRQLAPGAVSLDEKKAESGGMQIVHGTSASSAQNCIRRGH